MFLKKLASCLVLLLFCYSTFAAEGKGYQVLSETIKASPGLHYGFIPTPSGKKNLSADVYARAFDAKGTTRQNIQLTGQHIVSIINFTNQKQYYKYTYQLYCNGQSIDKTINISLEPHGSYYDATTSFFSLYSTLPGAWQIRATTNVQGESSDNDVAYGTLQVTR